MNSKSLIVLLLTNANKKCVRKEPSKEFIFVWVNLALCGQFWTTPISYHFKMRWPSKCQEMILIQPTSRKPTHSYIDPPGNWNIPPRRKEHHFQRCLRKGDMIMLVPLLGYFSFCVFRKKNRHVFFNLDHLRGAHQGVTICAWSVPWVVMYDGTGMSCLAASMKPIWCVGPLKGRDQGDGNKKKISWNLC